MLLDRLALRLNLTFSRRIEVSGYERRLRGRRLLLAKPQTYMNLSGQAVGLWRSSIRYAGESPGCLHDVDLPSGFTHETSGRRGRA